MSKKVLITGTSSGFGRLIAGTLLQNGHTVVASMRDVDGRNKNAAEALESAGARIVENMSGDDAPDPQWIADAAAKLVEQAAGERPFRTVVDGLGMGDLIDPYNQQHQELTSGIYNAFGMADMLTLKT